MKKPLSIQINIPNPCKEDWEQMSPCEQGRFCAQCQKQVIDFTQWSDTDLYHFLSKNDAPLCGRFTSYQLNRPIHIPYQPHSRLYRLAFGLGLVLLFTNTPTVNAQKRPPFVLEQTPFDNEQLQDEFRDHYSNGLYGAINGKVFDSNKHALAGAIIEIIEGSRINSKTITDYGGNYFVESVRPGRYSTKVSYTGYRSKIITDVIVSPNKSTKINVGLKIQTNALEPAIVIGYRVPLIQNYDRTPQNTITGIITSIYQVKPSAPAHELKTVPKVPTLPKKKDGINLDPYEPTKTIFTSEQIEKR